MKKYAPSICQVLGLKDWHQVYGKHFLQEDSPTEIAEHAAVLPDASLWIGHELAQFNRLSHLHILTK